MKKGFTLVELSIVLVIIGLLIGGILVAQSLIDSTKTQAFIRQLGQFDAAVATFESTYGQLPGDTIIIDGNENSNLESSLRGDNDGTIECFHPDPECEILFGEIATFWSDLSLAGLKSENSIDYLRATNSGAGLSPGVAPEAKLGQDASILAVGNSGKNFYAIANFGEPEDGLIPSPAFAPTEVLAVDIKIDDSIASTGNVKALDSGDFLSVFKNLSDGLTTGTDCTTTAGGDDYNVANDDVACTMRVRIGATTGVLY